MSAVIELDGIGRTFPGPAPVTALAGVDLTVNAGDQVALLGASGSGKSTMMNVLGLLDRPTSGRYRFEGVDTAGLDEERRAALRSQRIGFVFQSFHLVHDRSVRENVELPLLYHRVSPADRRRKATAALEAVALSHRLDARPATLSGGEQQRVAIARAVVTGPSLLLCDEPTGNLDSATRDQVLDVLAQLRHRGTTLVVITHDAEVAAWADRIVRLRDGRIADPDGGVGDAA